MCIYIHWINSILTQTMTLFMYTLRINYIMFNLGDFADRENNLISKSNIYLIEFSMKNKTGE